MSWIVIGTIGAASLILIFRCLGRCRDYLYPVWLSLRRLFRIIRIGFCLFAILSLGLSWLDASPQIQGLKP